MHIIEISWERHAFRSTGLASLYRLRSGAIDDALITLIAATKISIWREKIVKGLCKDVFEMLDDAYSLL